MPAERRVADPLRTAYDRGIDATAPTDGGVRSGTAELTARELQVLALAARGMTNAGVAQELGVSVHAVKFHLASVYRKLGVANRTQAAAFFVRAGGSRLSDQPSRRPA